MEFVNRDDIPRQGLPGRGIQKAVGKDSAIISKKMTVGYATYSEEFGPMAPHNHAEETIIIVDAYNGWIRTGSGSDDLPERLPVKKGMIIHFEPLEWHVFEYGNKGFIDVIFIYGQADNIRPEEIHAGNAQ